MEYFYIVITALVIVTLFLLFLMEKGKQARKPSHLPKFALILVILGIVFTDAGRLTSYSFFGAAVFISIIDIIRIRNNGERSI